MCNHTISGLGSPSALQWKYTVPPNETSTSLGSSVSLGLSEKSKILYFSIYEMEKERFRHLDFCNILKLNLNSDINIKQNNATGFNKILSKNSSLFSNYQEVTELK